MTTTAIVVIGAIVVAGIVVGVVFLQRRQNRALDALAADLGAQELRSGVDYEAALDGQAFRYAYFPGDQHQPSRFRVSVACASKGDFEIGRESRWDVFFKRLGLATEIQTGDAAFDDAFYVRTNSVAFTETCLRSTARRQSVARLFELNGKTIGHDGESVSVVISPFDPAKDREQLQLESIVRELSVVAKDPPRDYFEPLVGGRPVWKIRRWCVFAVSIASGAVGFALVLWGLHAFTPLDQGDVFVASLAYSVPAFLAFAILGVVLLKGRSSSHTEWMTNLAIAIVGIPLFGFGAVVTFNGAVDRSEPTDHDAEIVDKRISRSSRSTSYFVYVESWRPGRDRERLGVGSDAYDGMPIGSTLRVTTHPGELGFEWIADYQVVSAPESTRS